LGDDAELLAGAILAVLQQPGLYDGATVALKAQITDQNGLVAVTPTSTWAIVRP
jgi:hypothetical protein